MTDQVTFRYEPKESDLAEVRSMLQGIGIFRAGEIDVAEELVQDRLTKGRASEYFFVFAESGSGLEGYACYGPITVTESSHDLYWIAVRHDVMRSGLGSLVFSEVLARAAASGGTRMFVETSNDPQFTPARKFYERHGFEHVCTVPDFYAHGDHKIIYARGL